VGVGPVKNRTHEVPPRKKQGGSRFIQEVRPLEQELRKHRRSSIGRLMVVVGIIALNLWAGSVLFSIEPWILAGAAPAGLTLEFALYRLICSRGCARAFWAGVLAAGSLAAGSLVWGILSHESVNTGINVITGERMTITTPGLASGDRTGEVWAESLEFVVYGLARLPRTRGILTRDGAPQVIAGTVIRVAPPVADRRGGRPTGVAARLAGGAPPAPRAGARPD
jgi:hypothetical protein